ncbi:Glyoxylase, beta-lactamase superfamily II [Collimonas sp. OK307]|uniref:MBL fold metallo-hydrolase n=1 Tax=Collimonas sp. OK307 TaxID=1801620 RepID=UPI0008EE9DC2|nr:MBL fold metallo-hydrolase [Collimonas sp. OK307]SFH75191.1 Glyoxylase, beta-lactamase superfamily II [Collimonas sp. OK307]
MNALEAQLSYAFGDTLPASGATLEVAPGVRWLRMGLPFALDHINLWLLEDSVETDDGIRHGWTIVDCGIANDATRAAWDAIFASELRGLPVLRVLVTHCHPDHVGLADWLCHRWQAPLWMSSGEYLSARIMSAALPGADGSASLPHFQQHGMHDPEVIAKVSQRKSYYPNMVPAVPQAYHRLADQQQVRIGQHQWRVITGFGHAPEHVALHCTDLDLLISGDMVLPRISTNVSVFAIEPESNPVQQYMDSLEKYRALPTTTLVLPSHGKPFRGLQIRIDQLQQHHGERLAEVVEACTAAPQSASDIVPIMFRRPLDAHQMTFALGEALAHLHKLWFDGVLKRRLDADQVYRFGIAESV